MTFDLQFTSRAALAAAVFLAGCSGSTSAPPASRPGAPATSLLVAEPPPAPVASKATTAKAGPQRLAFTDAHAQTKQFITYYRSITLTPEQERIKVEALASIPAPCCSKFSLATCCCPCNMSKAVWGMAAWLITEKGADAGQVHQAALDWIHFINPKVFSGEACSNGGCNRPSAEDGCSGMDDSAVL